MQEDERRSKQVFSFAWCTLKFQCVCCCSARDSLQLRCRPSGPGRVSLLTGHSFNADVNLVFADDMGPASRGPMLPLQV